MGERVKRLKGNVVSHLHLLMRCKSRIFIEILEILRCIFLEDLMVLIAHDESNAVFQYS